MPTMEKVSQSFIQAVSEGPDYICNCCHRLMYRKTVKEFSCDKYTKVSSEILHAMFPPESEMVSAETKVWICKTCDYTLKRGKMPAQAKANNMSLVRLISLRIPFMKMVALPCGKQRAIHHYKKSLVISVKKTVNFFDITKLYFGYSLNRN